MLLRYEDIDDWKGSFPLYIIDAKSALKSNLMEKSQSEIGVKIDVKIGVKIGEKSKIANNVYT